MAQLGTGKIPTLLDGKAEDVTPAPLAIPQAQPKAQPFNLGALWAGLAAAGNGRTYESVTDGGTVKTDAPFRADNEKSE